MIGAERTSVGDIGDLGAPDAASDRWSPGVSAARSSTEFVTDPDDLCTAHSFLKVSCKV
jgi:hypothetical protein